MPTVSLESRLGAIHARPTKPPLTLLALVGLLGQLLANPKTRPLAERWITALEEASTLERGTTLTTGLSPERRDVEAAWRIHRLTPPWRPGKQVPHARAPKPDDVDWPSVLRDYYSVRGDLSVFTRQHPEADTREIADAIQRIYRARLGNGVPALESDAMNAILRALRQSTEAATRGLICRAHGLVPFALRKGLERYRPR